MYTVITTKKFVKQLKTLTAQEKNQVLNKLPLLAQSPMHPSLRTKKVQGSNGLFECSVNMDIRIIWHFEGDNVIVTVEVGHHDILKRY